MYLFSTQLIRHLFTYDNTLRDSRVKSVSITSIIYNVLQPKIYIRYIIGNVLEIIFFTLPLPIIKQILQPFIIRSPAIGRMYIMYNV